MGRREARVLAFQALFSWQAGVPLEEVLCFEWRDAMAMPTDTDETVAFARQLTIGVIENREIDVIIRRRLEHWSFDRLSAVALSILRLGVYELLKIETIPAAVTINEAVELAKRYGSDDSYRFVNGILDGICKHYDLA